MCTLPALNRSRSLTLALIAVCVSAACGSPATETPAPVISPDTWAVVDGRTISRDDVERAFRRTRDTSQAMPEEEALAAKLGLLNDLITQDILVAKAATLKVEVPESELDTAFNNMKKNIPDDAFQQELTRRGVTAAEMREGIRRELVVQKVIEQEVVTKITVSDQEVTDFFNANRAQFNVAEESYHIGQLVVTPVKEPQITNGTGDDATTPQASAAKVQMLMERLKAGANFGELAMGYSEDAESAPRGGDLGLIPVSRLRQAPAQLRNAVLNKEPGTLTVASDGDAHTIVLVAAHEQAGQRDLSTPAVRDGITRQLRGRKDQLLRTAYLTALRTDAKVVNYLARRLVEAQGKLPALQPAAPGAR